MDCVITKKPNLFIVDIQKKEHNLTPKISQVITTKIKPNSVGAEHLKSGLTYNGEDAEVWVFVAGGAPEN